MNILGGIDMKIGITERGDAGLDLSWVNKRNTVNGVVLITKSINKDFCEQLIPLHRAGYKFILHCTCTGYGGTALEPNVPEYKGQLRSLKFLIDTVNFPAEQCVLRIDPIFPSEKGMKRLRDVLDYFISLNTGVTRVRVSVVDEYKHVRERYAQRGWNPLYGGNFGPSNEQLDLVASVLNSYDFRYELCAENSLATKLNNCSVQGCVSYQDLEIMGLDTKLSGTGINPQNRGGCHCLSCKTELLTERKQCPHNCVYCFWKG